MERVHGNGREGNKTHRQPRGEAPDLVKIGTRVQEKLGQGSIIYGTEYEGHARALYNAEFVIILQKMLLSFRDFLVFNVIY